MFVMSVVLPGETMGLNIFFAGAFGYMVQWMNSIQMVIHLPMMQIIVPGNVSAYF